MHKKGYTRRDFIKYNSLIGLGAILPARAGAAGYGDGGIRSRDRDIGRIGGRTIEELRERYRSELFERFLPNMNRYAVDHEHGGVMCSLDVRTGELLSTEKRAWFVGRGLWLYSYLYNNLDQDPAWLGIAEKSKDLLLKVQPAGENFWPHSFTREGEHASEPGDIYGSLFVAEGLFEYAVASGEHQYWDLAKKIIFQCLDRYDRPDYLFNVTYIPDAPPIEAPRVLGHWMIFLSLSTQMLRHRYDREIKRLADRSIDAILNHHINPEYRLTNEIINHDLTIPDNEYAQLSVIGHGLETMAFVMFEAARRKDPELFRASCAEFKRHVDIAYDPVYKGYFHTLEHVNDYRWNVRKSLWNQEEVLTGTLFLIEHTGDPWAKKHFVETHDYIYDKFIRPDHKFWHSGGDRRLLNPNSNLLEHYHHARQLMYGLLSLDRIAGRDGKTSGLFG